MNSTYAGLPATIASAGTPALGEMLEATARVRGCFADQIHYAPNDPKYLKIADENLSFAISKLAQIFAARA